MGNSEADTILVAFADSSLGGTSRSAMEAGRVWKSLGHEVAFVPFLPIHPDREERFRGVGAVLDDVTKVDWSAIRLVHLHHGALSPQMHARIRELFDSVNVEVAPPLLSNNVFAVDDSTLDEWRGTFGTGVLGVWAAYQYMANKSLSPRNSWPFVLPNAQNDEYFRRPSEEERREARAELGMDHGHQVLRIGSPLLAKWSASYVALAQRVSAHRAHLTLVGAPPKLETQLPRGSSLSTHRPMSDDDRLRRMYWAADVFALDSSRGESFGNVVFEALLCGLPVVYRARPFRDNTPWELSSEPHFTYARTTRKWLRGVVPGPAGSNGRLDEKERTRLVNHYGYDAVAKDYESVLTRLETAKHGERVFMRPEERRLSWLDRLAVLAIHNRIMTAVKKRRLSR